MCARNPGIKQKHVGTEDSTTMMERKRIGETKGTETSVVMRNNTAVLNKVSRTNATIGAKRPMKLRRTTHSKHTKETAQTIIVE